MKQKKLKNNYVSDEQKEVRNLIIITVIIAAIAAGLYFFTEKVLNKKDNTDKSTEIEFDYNVCTIGNMFTRPYDEYYVFVYSSEDESAASYTALITSYRDKKAKKLYYIDLKDAFNKDAISDKTATKPANSSEVKVNGSVLYLIKNGKVSKAYTEKYSDILK